MRKPPADSGSKSALLKERLPVWEALSEFFLDTELEEKDHLRIARTLASAPYSLEELETILRNEVYPGLIQNLRCVAGDWAGFDREFLRQRLSPRLNQRSLLRFPLLQWVMIRDHWERVSELVGECRKTESSEPC